ncbi:hypothetical protein, partial [Streptomyces sp. NPDC055509]
MRRRSRPRAEEEGLLTTEQVGQAPAQQGSPAKASAFTAMTFPEPREKPRPHWTEDGAMSTLAAPRTTISQARPGQARPGQAQHGKDTPATRRRDRAQRPDAALLKSSRNEAGTIDEDGRQQR